MIVWWLSLLIIYTISFTIATPTNFTKESRHIPVHFFAPVIAPSLAGRCFGCLVPSADCTVPCSSPQRCFIRGPTPSHIDASSLLLGRSGIAIVEEDKRCFACTTFPHAGAASRCIVPCRHNQRCYLKAAHANATLTDRRCTDERWVNDLLVDGCLTYNNLYWCMCSTDLCNSGDFNSIRGYDDCSNNPCPSGTVCLDTKEGFSCICPPWQADCTYAFSVSCSCKNGGRCMMGLGTYICECPYGYSGINCETRYRRQSYSSSSSSASSSPCRNRCEQRTCTYQQSSSGLAPTSCTCGPPSRYSTSSSSYRVAQPYVACNPNPCQHGQTCYSVTSYSFFCMCQVNYIGALCERRDACQPNPCQNEGSCIFDEPSGSFRCYCPPGYTGRTCDIQSNAVITTPPDPCSPNPCQNGGICQANNIGGFMCLCPAGFEGICCEIRSDPCKSNPCQNNGICMASAPSFVCSCTSGYSGQRCEIRDPCAQNPCLNAGQCHSNGISGFACVCIQPFTGQRCEDR
ncbi:unnamed protein product, partial [Adineta steineri]